MFQRSLAKIVILVLIAGATYLRFAPLASVLPYSDYIDEGYVLNQTIDHLNTKSYDCRWYGYPTLPSYLNTAAMYVAAPFYRFTHHHSFRKDLPPEQDRHTELGENYNLISPPELILAGRVVVALLSVATVLLAGAIGRRLGGAKVEWLAMLFTAVCPALVLRGSTIIVDSFATFFTMACLFFIEKFRAMAKTDVAVARREILFAGICAGLAVASKYTAGSIFIAVVVIVIMSPVRAREKLRLLLIASGGLVVAAICAMPALVLQPGKILGDLRNTAAFYKGVSSPSYWEAALSPSEVGLPLLAAGLCGTALMLWQRSTRISAIGWMAFASVLLVPLVRANFQPFRNVLLLVPLLCVAAAFLFSVALQPFRRRWVRAPLAFFALGAALAIGFSCGTLSLRYVRDRMRHVDSRVVAVDWLARTTQRSDSVLALEELVILPSEWKRVPGKVRVVPWRSALEILEREQVDYLVGGEIELHGRTEPDRIAYLADWQSAMARLSAAATFGEVPTPILRHLWLTNDERIVIRKPHE